MGPPTRELLDRLGNRFLVPVLHPLVTDPSWPGCWRPHSPPVSEPPPRTRCIVRWARYVEELLKVGPRRARRRLRLRAPNAGDHPQDPQPAERVPGFVRAGRRLHGSSMSCASSPVSWVWRVMPRCWPSATSAGLDGLDPELVRGPVRKRLVDGRPAPVSGGTAAVADGYAVEAILPSARRPRCDGWPKPASSPGRAPTGRAR